MFKKRRPESLEERFAKPLFTIDVPKCPSGVAVKSNGEIIVSERDRHCVSIYSSKGKKISTFGREGKREGQFLNPSGVAVDKDDHILVGDLNNHRVQRFFPDGTFLVAGGTYGSGLYPDGPVQYKYPGKIAVNPVGNNVYAGDFYRVLFLRPDLNSFFDRIGDDISSPGGIACDKAGNVYIGDTDTHCVHVYTIDGELLRKFGKKGDGKGELAGPYGMAIDSNKNLVYVSENNNHRVSVFTTEGEFVTTIGKKGDGKGEVEYPGAITVDANGVVYLCDKSRVQVF